MNRQEKHMNFKLTALTLLVLLASACAHHAQISQNEDGSYLSFIRSSTRDSAEQTTYDDAVEFCKNKNLMIQILKKDVKYTGSMDETTRNTIRKASGVASVLGGVNSPVSDAGHAGYMMTSDKDYQSELIFKCKSL
jgi:hypothetical protein